MSANSEIKQSEKITVHVDTELKDLIPGFIEDWKKETYHMREALEKGNFKVIRTLGHKMKGTGGGCGFDGVSDLGGDLERAAADRNTWMIRKTLDTLSSYLERVELVFQ